MEPDPEGKSNGPLRDLPLSRDSSLSPMSRSPLSSSPNASRHKLHVPPSGAEPRQPSPLRTGHTAAKRTQHHSPSPRSTPMNHAPSYPPSSALKQEFPFSAAPGTAGQTPTNDLIHRIDHANALAGSADLAATSSAPSHVMTSRSGPQDGHATPVGRRSVQFAGPIDAGAVTPNAHSRQASWDHEAGDTTEKEKDGSRLLTRLKSLASPAAFRSHSRSLSNWTLGGDSAVEGSPTPISPGSEREVRLHEDEGDADAEESGVEGPSGSGEDRRRRRRFRKQVDHIPATAPTTPKQNRRPSFSDLLPSSSGSPRPNYPTRSVTLAGITENQRAGYSEDEGRDRLTNSGMWRRSSNWMANRGASTYAPRQVRTVDPSESKRPSALRRLTAFATSSTHDEDGSPSASRRFDRSASMVGLKWKTVKANLKLYSRRDRLDHAKSAELVAELLAGAPAALIFASMFLKDERGHKRVPVLLEQLKLRVTEKKKVETESGAHTVFRIELEYGSSVARMKWSVERTYKDIVKLYFRYKGREAQSALSLRADSERSRQPKLPKEFLGKSQLDDLRDNLKSKDMPQIEEEEDEEENHTAGEQSGTDLEPSRTDRPSPGNRRGSSLAFIRRKTSLFNVGSPGGADARDLSDQREAAIRRAEKRDSELRKLEDFLTKMVTWVMFHPSSNRLCRWLEFSALGVRLAAEGGYHGKEGYLFIRKMTGLDSRPAGKRSLFRPNAPRWKWFLVRHSYIVSIDSPDTMNIYDVYLIDHAFTVIRKEDQRKRDQNAREIADRAKDRAAQAIRHHRLKLTNSERTMKLQGSERNIWQFKESIDYMAKNTIWAQKHRFNSFAPVRSNVYAQFLVDGRDYMWNVSRAISMARDVIYIHDWWLSPELYMRRPAAISQRWRLDRLLKRKAEEGVKIYIIVYRNVESAIPIDSEYTKFSLLDLSDNVYVQRSPNQLRQGTFFWSHHEKICVVDHCVAFCGGVDLCFGRWDTPSHSLTDDKGTGFELNDLPKDADHCQLWPGKDYSNPRVQDFFNLDKPYEEMYDRAMVPRMPWHDIGMQIVGQPARDLSRHFIQRWNYVLRQRTPSRPTPMLLPPPDFEKSDLETLGLNGTCEIQILRSSGMWSLGIHNTEHSIMNAYVEMIRTSEHFVYMENQFFITTCHNSRVQVLNLIGDALVQRIIRAHENGEAWRCIIVIPLVPGYQNTVDVPDGYSVRLIMQCQWWSINRGDTSIFGRLRKHGIDPSQYIEFFSLRTWGQIGPDKALVTEQLYIHAKIMVVDDRIAIIGSANINERSLLGDRDSEIAAIVRDTDMVQSCMAGEPYMVGRFAHDLRMRLMREHLGLDVDEIREEEEVPNWEKKDEILKKRADDVSHKPAKPDLGSVVQELMHHRQEVNHEVLEREEGVHTLNHDMVSAQVNNPHMKSTKKLTADPRITGNQAHFQDVVGLGPDKMLDHEITAKDHHGRDTAIDTYGREVLVSSIAPEGRGSIELPSENTGANIIHRRRDSTSADDLDQGAEPAMRPPNPPRMDTFALGLPYLSTLPAVPATDDTDIGGPPLMRRDSTSSKDAFDIRSHPILMEVFTKGRPLVHKDCMRDPLNDDFYNGIWTSVAENNTKLFRSVFRCMPDNEVRTWTEYKAYMAFAERFAQSQGLSKSKDREQQESKGKSGPPGNDIRIDVMSAGEAIKEKASLFRRKHKKEEIASLNEKKPFGTVDEWAKEQQKNVDDLQVTKDSIDEKEALKTDDASQGSGVNGSAVTNGNAAPHLPTLQEKDKPTDQSGPRPRTVTISEPAPPPHQTPPSDPQSTTTRPRGNTASTGPPTEGVAHHPSVRRRHRAATARSRATVDENTPVLSSEEAEGALRCVQGSLVVFPYDWLEREEQGTGAWMWSVDTLAPLEIYT